jgi:hypothetical protein
MPTKANPPVRPAPKLSPCPTGKLAHRYQNVKDVPSTPTPFMAVSVPHCHGQVPTWEGCTLMESLLLCPFTLEHPVQRSD